MLSLFDQGVFAPPPARFNLAAHALAGGADAPDRIALQIVGLTGTARWSYSRLTAAVRGTGGGLLAMGLKPGDRVLMRQGNTVGFPILFLGAIAAGLVPVPTSSQQTVPEVEAIAAGIAPATIAAGPGIALPSNPACLVLDEAALAALRNSPPCAWDMGSPERLAYIVYTSGTSGGRAR